MTDRFNVEHEDRWMDAFDDWSKGEQRENRLVQVGRLIGSLVKMFGVNVDIVGILVTRTGVELWAYPLLYGILSPYCCEVNRNPKQNENGLKLKNKTFLSILLLN